MPLTAGAAVSWTHSIAILSVLQVTSFCCRKDAVSLEELLPSPCWTSNRTPVPVTVGEVLLHKLQLISEPDPSLLEPCHIPFLQIMYIVFGQEHLPSCTPGSGHINVANGWSHKLDLPLKREYLLH